MTATLIRSEVDFAPEPVLTPLATYDEIISRYHTEIYGFALQLTRRRSEADDLYRETLFNAFCAVDRLDGAVSHRAWLYKIATKTFLSGGRRSDREGTLDAVVESDGQIGQDAQPQSRELLSEVAAVVHSLPAEQRVALVMRKYQGLGYGEIAASLDSSEETVRSDVHEALRKLREHFAGRL